MKGNTAAMKSGGLVINLQGFMVGNGEFVLGILPWLFLPIDVVVFLTPLDVVTGGACAVGPAIVPRRLPLTGAPAPLVQRYMCCSLLRVESIPSVTLAR